MATLIQRFLELQKKYETLDNLYNEVHRERDMLLYELNLLKHPTNGEDNVPQEVTSEPTTAVVTEPTEDTKDDEPVQKTTRKKKKPTQEIDGE